eukprot:CAMPEP_0175058486 /NCGR_PEP_ID=MMETSP0052_2-20121109/11873_1 /TAXON_ID=51329 ORGANISM="Polytomella parva, Strain SAG 63-3" /NCGR_SAMPLE_ID=MMETSP0052_2 /ASSEMBLY_ACC=CAM_ASM_000194 /LENGTH=426 /DNA_ID=CAMNT_0016323869 /DNA_START=29 /DNA_END=1309 /DNA_ORIENTATION=-
MKIKLINRNEEDYTKERSQDVKKVFKNYDPKLKPFLAAMPHTDGVTALARSPTVTNSLVTGTADGEVRIWDIAQKRTLRKLVGHSGAIKGISYAPDGETCVTCSTDCTVKLWKVPYAPFEAGVVQADAYPVYEFQAKSALRSINHHWNSYTFATGSNVVDIWDHNRSEPIQSFTWGSDAITSVRFNPAEPDIFASTGSDRGIALYDLRTSTPIRKLVMQTRSNALAWNPMEAFNFTVANEDCNLYSFDMRKLQSSTCVHKDFVSSVMDVDYSPTGREFVAGGYDRSVRIFAYNGGHSREVYTTKRMQRVFAVCYSGDGSYVFSGSDDMNLRVWKSEASEQLGIQLPREKRQHAYRKALLERYKHMPEIKRIVRHKHLPVAIYKTANMRRTVQESDKKKLRRRIEHSKPGSITVKPERKKKILAELE